MVDYASLARDFVFWKGVYNLKNVIVKGIGKNISNGRTTNFWQEKWLGDFTLWDCRLTEISNDLLNSSVADMWNGGRWKWEILQDLLPH